MNAISRKAPDGKLTQEIEIRVHRLLSDEPPEDGGEDQGPSPQELLAASLASCTAITVDMYAKRKGWAIDQIEVECSYEAPERGQPTKFELVLRLPASCDDEQRARLTVIAGKCPVHRILAGEVTFDERVEAA